MPNLRASSYGSGDQTWLANTHGIEDAVTANLPVSGFTAQTHYPNGYLPSGTPVDYADPKAVKPYAEAEGAVLGFLLFDVEVPTGATDVAAAVLTHGIIKPANVPGEFTAPATAAGFTFMKGADA